MKELLKKQKTARVNQPPEEEVEEEDIEEEEQDTEEKNKGT
jgi:hypothetical protein